jgi:two-component system chemotaxis response regulator CheY
MPINVIVVDDSKFLIKQIVEFMEKQLDCKIVATGNDGNECVDLYRKYKPDLITLDINMPNKDGKSALKDILNEFPDAKVLMISAVRGGTMLECMNAGAAGYIEKPLKFADSEFVRDFKDTFNEIIHGKG